MDSEDMGGDDMGKAECTHELGPRDRDFTGSSGNDVICGNDRNNNSLDGLGGDDTIRGEGGNDTLNGGVGDDELYGGAGDDTLFGNEGNDMLFGGAGKDVLDGGAGKDELDGGLGDDMIVDKDLDGIDTFEGGGGIDTLDYSAPEHTQDKLNEGRSQDDTADVYWHVDLTEGETGKGNIDAITGGIADLFDYISGIENVKGTAGRNHLVGDGNNNVLTGGAANDKIKGMGGNDTINGGAGSYGEDPPKNGQLLDGGAGNDTLIVGETFNLLTEQIADQNAPQGIRGFENLDASSATSPVTLTGDKGPNMLIGGTGDDTLVGGMGADTFVIVKGAATTNDTITDYKGKGTDEDKIYLKGFSADEKKEAPFIDEGGSSTTVQVPKGNTVATLSSGGSAVDPRTVTVMFMD